MTDSASSSQPFSRYAAWYDAFNREKDYAAEVVYVLGQVERWRRPVDRWLDFGCGTGGHLEWLVKRGLSVEGVDRSPEMIGYAKGKLPAVPLYVGPLQSVQASTDRDVVSLLFHAIDYQVDDDALAGTLLNARRHLAPEGLLVFDFWNTQAVRRDPPRARSRSVEIGQRTMWRLTEPVEHAKEHLIDVRFEFHWDAPDGPLAHEEVHAMRHFSPAELDARLSEAGFTILVCTRWMTDQPLEPDDWYGFVVARQESSSSV